jgi:uncharacterized cupredoxin-like copper-binding protein
LPRSRRPRPVFGPLFVLLLAAVAGCSGETGQGESAEEVAVTLSEFAFAASSRTFKAGIPYRFVLRNTGTVAHEWAVVPRGATDEAGLLIEVEEEELPPGATVAQAFTFPAPGEYDFACFMAGHYESGMKLPITVTQ